MAEFKVFKKGKEFPSASVERDDMLARVDQYLSRGTEGRAWYKHREPQKHPRPVDRVRERVAALTRAGDVGSRILVKLENIEDTLVIVKVEKSVAVPDLGCHPEIERAHALLWNKYGEEHLRSAGRWYCRNIAGTNTVSRHGYYGRDWKGAAEDVFGEGTHNNMTSLYDMQKFLVRKCEAGELDLYTVIAGDKRWRKGEGWTKYTGEFHTHIHYDTEGGRPCSP